MAVASGQMPYEFDTPLPIRAPAGAWPGVDTPNVAMSGLTIEQAMFVYNAELRKWNFPDQLNLLQYNLYNHPDITPSSFEPKANGDTLAGLVGGRASLESIDNIERLRRQLNTFLFDFYTDDTVYGTADFREAWLSTAYPESPSGSRIVVETNPSIPLFSLTGPNFLHPALEDVTGGEFIRTTDTHWLGGSGVIFDIDCGEVVFNPFPFPRERQFSSPVSSTQRFSFGPIYPLVQTTAGALPSVEVSRYDDVTGTDFLENVNVSAINSGLVEIDGYALVDGTTIELVIGNDSNIEATVGFTSDYTGHTQGLRAVRDGAGKNDPSARCYRTPTAQSSGLYRVLTHNQKADVPHTAIPSGFVSIWPQGLVRKVVNTSELYVNNSNFIHGRELTVTSDGGLQRVASDSTGLHVMDDCFWVTTPNDSDGSGSLDTRGLYIVSPHNGEAVWYRPAELGVSTSGTTGPGGATFNAHLGLVDLGSDWVRIARTCTQFFETNIGTPTPNSDRVITTVHFQRYNKTSLDHTEESTQYTLEGEDVITALFSSDGINGGLIRDGSDVYIYSTSDVVRFDTSLNFVAGYAAPIAARRHVANGQLLYTITGSIEVSDPMLDPGFGGGFTSGIGVWTRTEPAGTPSDGLGNITHDSAKPFRGETHFGLVTGNDIAWHTIFDVTGSTHVADGVWGILQVDTPSSRLYLVRITEESDYWMCHESIRLNHTPGSIPPADTPDDFPYEAVVYDID